jgi:hypothetical protein
MNLEPYFTVYKNKSKQFIDLNIKILKDMSKSSWPQIREWVLRYNTKSKNDKKESEEVRLSSKIKNLRYSERYEESKKMPGAVVLCL